MKPFSYTVNVFDSRYFKLAKEIYKITIPSSGWGIWWIGITLDHTFLVSVLLDFFFFGLFSAVKF